MATITEIAPDTFRISTFVSDFNLQFNQFLVRDEEPLLFHTGLRAIFPAVMDAVASLIEPARLRWIGFSHVEADECGSLLSGRLLRRRRPPCAVWSVNWSTLMIAWRSGRPEA
jgi:flavorubredoxin